MKRLKIMKSYMVLWLFIYFLVHSNIEAISVFFFATLTFNLAVLTLLTIGIIMVMKAAINLVMLAGTFGILAYKKDNLAFYLQDIDKIMPANIAHMFYARAEKGVLLFTTEESRDVIEWIEEKFSHQNRYTNYFIGTVLMIGLLGTFSGLLIAIDDMGRIILSLSGDIDLAKVISDFSGPLGGMAVGFGSSLFGVIAAIILGLMGYILNKNQETLVEGVEDWLKGRIINTGGITSTTSIGTEVSDMPDHKASFMEVFIDNISTLSNEMSKMSQTNERLNSATIASIQAARDEHEISVTLFEDINKSLKNIDTNAQNSTKLAIQQFDALQNTISSNHKQLIASQKESILTLIDRIESSLQITQEVLSQKLQNISEHSSDELKEQTNSIVTILRAIDTQLIEKQKLLFDIQLDNKQNQEINEDFLKQLILLIKDSSSKLDIEYEALQSIHKELELDNENSKEHFQGITASLTSLSQTLQNETQSLNSLKEIQTEQSEIMKDNAKSSQDIRQTLLESQMQSLKQEEHLSEITSKIDSFKEQMTQAHGKSLEMLGETIKPLENIIEVGKNQNESLKDLLGTGEKNANEAQNHLNTITTELESVNEQIAQANNNSIQMIDANKQELQALENILLKNEEYSNTQEKQLNNLTSKLESLNEEIAKTNKTSLQMMEANAKEFKTLTEIENVQSQTLDKLLKTDKHSSNVLDKIQKNTTKLRPGGSNKNKKSDSFFDKLFK